LGSIAFAFSQNKWAAWLKQAARLFIMGFMLLAKSFLFSVP
jgi:hypothetical protein